MAGWMSNPVQWDNMSNPIEDSLFRSTSIRRVPPRDLPIKPIVINPTQPAEDDYDDEEYKATIERYVGIAVSLATIITENLLIHPMVVLRRQCQVQPGGKRWHMTPFTLAPVVLRLYQHQGVSTLWKGLGSCLLVRGFVLFAEDSLSKFTPWPKDISLNSTCKNVGQHLLLKSVSLALVTPFYSASLVETVQSDIASEKPGLFDVAREGIYRCVCVGAARGRMLPVWALVGPTVVHGMVKYLIMFGVHSAASWTIRMQLRAEQAKKGAFPKDSGNEENLQQIEVTSCFIGMVAAEVICYPLETILHRLHLQGTRTIVDQLDNGTEVVPILTAYGGVMDCYSDAVAREGFGGLYRGLGALMMQLAVHWAVIKLTRFAVNWGASVLRPPPQPRSARPPVRELREWASPDCNPGGRYLIHKDDDWHPMVTSTPTTTPVNFLPPRPDSH